MSYAIGAMLTQCVGYVLTWHTSDLNADTVISVLLFRSVSGEFSPGLCN